MDDIKFLHKYLDLYKSSTSDLLQIGRGITFVEGFVLTSFMKEIGVDLIIESGMAFGMSTEIFAKCMRDIPIISIDNDRYKVFNETTKRLSKYKNIQTIFGDSFKEIPSLLNKKQEFKKIALFIDGPKGRSAIKLGKDLLNDKRIKLISIHDIHIKGGMFSVFENNFGKSFSSHNLENEWVEIRDNINNYYLDLNLERHPSNSSTFKEYMEEVPLGPGIAISLTNE